MDRFAACLQLIRREEGGNDDDPRDHGGRTSRGITQREYDADRASQGLPPQDVWQATDQEVDDIYRRQYWMPYCPDLPPGLDLVFFDFNVNAGLSRAVKALQSALGVPADGMLGVRTRAALAEQQNIGVLVHGYSEYRRQFYRALKQFPVYGRGWLARTDRIERAAAQMAQSIPYPSGAPAASPKAFEKDVAEPVVSPEAGAATATGTTVGVGIVDQIQQATSQIAPLQYSVSIVKYVLIAVAMIAFAATLYGIWKRRKVKEAIG